jgi:hypothetical protein
MSTRNLPGVKSGRRVRLTASPPFVSRLSKKMWEPRRLTTLWASTACYRDSFTFTCCNEICRFITVFTKALCGASSIQFMSPTCSPRTLQRTQALPRGLLLTMYINWNFVCGFSRGTHFLLAAEEILYWNYA